MIKKEIIASGTMERSMDLPVEEEVGK